MNITLTITGGTAAEIQQAVQDLSNSFAIGVKGELLEVKSLEPTKKTKNVDKASVPNKVESFTENVEGKDEKEPALNEGKITIEEIRAAANAVAESGKRQEVKSLITSFEGAKNINSLDAKYYPEFIEKLKKL